MKDQAIVIKVLNEAGQILVEYLESIPRNAEATLDKLIQTLDNQQFAGALWRLESLDITMCHSACNIDPLSRGIGVQN